MKRRYREKASASLFPAKGIFVWERRQNRSIRREARLQILRMLCQMLKPLYQMLKPLYQTLGLAYQILKAPYRALNPLDAVFCFKNLPN